jgi:SAM-dependent methyltransferase
MIARQYLAGNGIEIGPLQRPLNVPDSDKVQYIDRLPIEELRKQYPELKDHKLIEPDIIDSGEELSKIKDNTLDFVIACHFLEHCENPIKAIQNMLRVLRSGGILFIAPNL